MRKEIMELVRKRMINGRKTIADSFDGCIPDDSEAYDVPALVKKIKELEQEVNKYKAEADAFKNTVVSAYTS
jgi:hypothetical protein